MIIVPLEGTELPLPAIAKMAKDRTVILTQRGKPLAAVKDVSGSDWESVALAANPEFVALIEQSRRSYSQEGRYRNRQAARGAWIEAASCEGAVTRGAG